MAPIRRSEPRNDAAVAGLGRAPAQDFRTAGTELARNA
jgi:hypothetical protein